MTVQMLVPDGFAKVDYGSPLGWKIVSAYPYEEPKVRGCCGDWQHGFVCLRRAGHDGPHVAHSGEDSVAAWWPNEAK